jgi:hypothetical protein
VVVLGVAARHLEDKGRNPDTKGKSLRRARGRTRLRRCRQRDHGRRPRWGRSSGGRGRCSPSRRFPDGTWEECTGTLISAHVLLSAEHCDLGVSRVEVTFASTFDRATSTTYWGTWYGDPDYNQASSDPHDLSVVVLDKSVRGITPARMPTEDSLSSLAGDQQFTPVGYGAQSVTSGAGGKTFHYADVRYRTGGTLNTLTKVWLKLSMNPSHGFIAGTTITGDTPCRSTNVDYRLDTPAARAFLGQFVTLP